MTLKTGVMMLKDSALITEINYILKHIQTVILNIRNISQHYCFCCTLDQINAGLVNRRDLFKTHTVGKKII